MAKTSRFARNAVQKNSLGVAARSRSHGHEAHLSQVLGVVQSLLLLLNFEHAHALRPTRTPIDYTVRSRSVAHSVGFAVVVVLRRTLRAVKDDATRAGIPYGWYLLDSWWCDHPPRPASVCAAHTLRRNVKR